MDYRRTSIKGQKKNSKSALEGDLVDSGALIFTKTTLDMHTIKKCGGFWRFLIRIIQWFRWARQSGNPSTITHVDGWDGEVAFGSDLCDPDGGGLNRHRLPIVPHCFTRSCSSNDLPSLEDDSVEVVSKKNGCHLIKLEDLALGDYEVIQLPEPLRLDFLAYQEYFRNDDIKYSLGKAAKSAFIRSRFSLGVKKISLADAIFCYLKQPFRDHTGGVIEVCCSSFLARILMALEHKQKLEKLLASSEFELSEKWQHSFKNLKRGFELLNSLYQELRNEMQDFDNEWHYLHEAKEKGMKSRLLSLCVDFEERRGYLIRRIRNLSARLAKRIYTMTDEFFELGYYNRFINPKEDPVVFTLNPECVTPAKLYSFLYQMSEKGNEP